METKKKKDLFTNIPTITWARLSAREDKNCRFTAKDAATAMSMCQTVF